MAKSDNSSSRLFASLPNVIYLVLMLLLLYFVVPRLHNFVISADQLTDINPGWVALGIAFFGASFLFSGAIYYLLSGSRLPYWRTVLVQIAGIFVNRLTPAGSGALGVSYLYLRHQKFSRPRAVAAISANNLLGIFGHALLLAVLIIIFPSALHGFHGPSLDMQQGLVVAGAVLVAIVVLLHFSRLRKALERIGWEAVGIFLDYRRRPAAMFMALGLSMCLTLSYAACLYAAALAAGVLITPLEAFVVLSVSVAAGAVIPTPGGLGAAEAGVVAGMISFGVAPSYALVAALLYRAVTFWLALIAGAGAFVLVGRKGYVGLSVHRR